MTEEEKLKKINASIAYWKRRHDIEFERTKRNADIIGIIGLIAYVVFSLFLVTGALTFLMMLVDR